MENDRESMGLVRMPQPYLVVVAMDSIIDVFLDDGLRDAVHRKIVTMNKGTCFTQVLLLDGKQILRGNAHVQPLGAPSSSSRKKAKVAKDSEKITKYFKPT